MSTTTTTRRKARGTGRTGGGGGGAPSSAAGRAKPARRSEETPPNDVRGFTKSVSGPVVAATALDKRNEIDPSSPKSTPVQAAPTTEKLTTATVEPATAIPATAGPTPAVNAPAVNAPAVNAPAFNAPLHESGGGSGGPNNSRDNGNDSLQPLTATNDVVLSSGEKAVAPDATSFVALVNKLAATTDDAMAARTKQTNGPSDPPAALSALADTSKVDIPMVDRTKSEPAAPPESATRDEDVAFAPLPLSRAQQIQRAQTNQDALRRTMLAQLDAVRSNITEPFVKGLSDIQTLVERSAAATLAATETSPDTVSPAADKCDTVVSSASLPGSADTSLSTTTANPADAWKRMAIVRPPKSLSNVQNGTRNINIQSGTDASIVLAPAIDGAVPKVSLVAATTPPTKGEALMATFAEGLGGTISATTITAATIAAATITTTATAPIPAAVPLGLRERDLDDPSDDSVVSTSAAQPVHVPETIVSVLPTAPVSNTPPPATKPAAASPGGAMMGRLVVPPPLVESGTLIHDDLDTKGDGFLATGGEFQRQSSIAWSPGQPNTLRVLRNGRFFLVMSAAYPWTLSVNQQRVWSCVEVNGQRQHRPAYEFGLLLTLQVADSLSFTRIGQSSSPPPPSICELTFRRLIDDNKIASNPLMTLPAGAPPPPPPPLAPSNKSISSTVPIPSALPMPVSTAVPVPGNMSAPFVGARSSAWPRPVAPQPTSATSTTKNGPATDSTSARAVQPSTTASARLVRPSLSAPKLQSPTPTSPLTHTAPLAAAAAASNPSTSNGPIARSLVLTRPVGNAAIRSVPALPASASVVTASSAPATPTPAPTVSTPILAITRPQRASRAS